MTIAIDATVGGASSNAYVTEIEQIAYMATRLNASAWTTVSGTACTENEKKAMIAAARELSPMRWNGSRTEITQALSWPRFNCPNPDGISAYDVIDDDVIPQRIKDAACELAFEFLRGGTTDISSADANASITEKTVDVLTTKYAAPSQRATGLARFPLVMKLIGPLQEIGSGQVRLVR